MNSKTLIGGLLGGIVAFGVGYVIYGLLLKDFFNEYTWHPEIKKDPPLIWAIGVANLAWGLLTAYIFNMGGVKTPGKGFVNGFIIFCLVTLGCDLFVYAQLYLFNLKLLAADVALSAVIGALGGTVVGWWLGRGGSAT